MTGIESGILAFGNAAAKDFLSGALKSAGQDAYDATKKLWKKNFDEWSPDYDARLNDALFRIARRQKIDAHQEDDKRRLVIDRAMDVRLLVQGEGTVKFGKLNDIYDFWRDYGDKKRGSALVDPFLAACTRLNVEETIEKLKQLGGWRTLVHAPGGFGKTSFLLRVTAQAIQDKTILPVFFDLAMRPHIDGDLTVRKFIEAYSIVAGMTAENFVDILAYAEVLDRTVLIIVDGINQESRIPWDQVRESILTLTRGVPKIRISVLLSDRMNDRQLQDQNYEIATIAPLSQEFIKQRLASGSGFKEINHKSGWYDILDTPLFLELAETSWTGDETPSRARLIEKYLSTTITGETGDETTHLTAEMIDGVLGKAAYRFYEEAKHTEINSEDFRRLLNDSKLFVALESSGIIASREVDGAEQTLVSFFQQTIHDYLAARYLAAVDPKQARTKWSSEAFDVVSLDQASYDALELAAEHIAQETSDSGTQSASNTLVLQAYDWSLKGTLKIITRLHQLGRDDVLSKPLLWALYGVNLEKKFEVFQHSIDSAREYFEEILPSNAKAAWEESAGDLETLIDFITAHEAFDKVKDEEYWCHWLELFGRKAQRTTMNDLVDIARDPLFGWTAANVFRRPGCQLENDSVERAVRVLYKASRFDAASERAGAILRWRIVHMLGRCTAPENVEFLLDVACDNGDDERIPEYHMTRYGALRSYLEATSMSPTPDESLERLAERLGEALAGDGHHRKRMADLLSKTPLFVKTPNGWDESFKCVLDLVTELNAEGASQDDAT